MRGESKTDSLNSGGKIVEPTRETCCHPHVAK